jgi:hypothetical protein
MYGVRKYSSIVCQRDRESSMRSSLIGRSLSDKGGQAEARGDRPIRVHISHDARQLWLVGLKKAMGRYGGSSIRQMSMRRTPNTTLLTCFDRFSIWMVTGPRLSSVYLYSMLHWACTQTDHEAEAQQISIQSQPVRARRSLAPSAALTALYWVQRCGK